MLLTMKYICYGFYLFHCKWWNKIAVRSIRYLLKLAYLLHPLLANSCQVSLPCRSSWTIWLLLLTYLICNLATLPCYLSCSHSLLSIQRMSSYSMLYNCWWANLSLTLCFTHNECSFSHFAIYMIFAIFSIMAIFS